MKTKLIKNAAAALLALAMGLSLTACGHQHTWADATCTTPKTCTECGKTEGEVLAHDWQDATCSAPQTCSLCKETEGEALPHTWTDATCSAPKTCSVCGETEGEPLPHTLTEANYQSPATCTVCGAEVGEPLTPPYEEHPFPLMEPGVTYDCVFPTYDRKDVDATTHVTLIDSQRFDSDEEHPAVEGYEYRTADIEVEIYGDAAWEYGYQTAYLAWDYYSKEPDDPDNVDRSGRWDENNTAQLSINYNGVDWEGCWIHCDYSGFKWDRSTRTNTGTIHFTILQPAGYDGVIVGMCDPRYDVNTAAYLSDVYEDGHFVLYRLT